MIDRFKVTIPQLTEDEERDAFVYVPDFYDPDSGDCYPVLYMFDGQNLFYDETASFGKCWGLKEFLEENDVPLIVASVECNTHPEHYRLGGRLSEYTPFSFDDPHWGHIDARGQITMEWFVNEFKPFIDANYPTLPERRYTFISGSSMGGLMTLYAITCYNHVFSRGAALSPSLSFAPKQVKQMIKDAKIRRGTVLYMDYGEKELFHSRAEKDFRDVTSLLQEKRILLETRIVPKGIHSESSWEKQVPFFMNVLFYDL